MQLKKYSAILLSISLLITGCSNFSIPTNANAAFENFTLNLFQQDVTASTLNLHYTIQNPEDYGIKASSITFGSYDIDETGSLAAIENCQSTLNKFSYRSLSEENQLTYDVLSSYLKTALFDEKKLAHLSICLLLIVSSLFIFLHHDSILVKSSSVILVS